MSFEAFVRILLVAICLGLMFHDVNQARTAERVRALRARQPRRRSQDPDNA